MGESKEVIYPIIRLSLGKKESENSTPFQLFSYVLTISCTVNTTWMHGIGYVVFI